MNSERDKPSNLFDLRVCLERLARVEIVEHIYKETCIKLHAYVSKFLIFSNRTGSFLKHNGFLRKVYEIVC